MPFFKRKKTASRRRKSKFAVFTLWVKRIGIGAAALSLTIWLGSWFVLSGAAARTGDAIERAAENAGAQMGFRVQDVLVEGRVNADAEVILAMVNTHKGAPLFAFDPDDVREQIERISWVKTVDVERRLPGTIYIRLTERQPLSFWQENGKLRLIDTEGQVIQTGHLSRFKDLIIVIGADAPKNAPELMANLLAQPDLYERVEAARRVGGRRWDLVMKNKITAKLPEGNTALAIASLAKAQREDSLLDKDIEYIDLRGEGRMIVRTAPGAVEEYKASLESKENNI